ncbi:MAG TPA: YchJ family metal-binding protein [Burkholderiaceae bacterium]
MAKNKTVAADCPCGGKSYATCCERFHRGALPETAEQLMRSRYSAYVLGLWDYVFKTWDERTRPELAQLQQDGRNKWLGLEVKKHTPDGDKATVEFVARYKVDGRAQRLHEVSRFERHEGQWIYVDGSFPEN